MPLEYLDSPDPAFEPLAVEPAYAVMDRHPSGRYVAMEAKAPWDGLSAIRVAVWDTTTRRVVWNPGGLLALCWLLGGREMLVVRSQGMPKPHLTQVAFFRGERPERARDMRTVELLTWPDDVPREEPRALDAAPMPLPLGEVIDAVPSPAGGLAAVVWLDQCEAGVELVSWADGAPLTQLPHRGYYGKRSNALSAATFSPDGRFLVLIYGAWAWWSGEAEDPEEPSPGGAFPCGWIVIGDVRQGTYTEHAVAVTVAAGWAPTDADRAEYDFVRRPKFTDAETFTVRLGTGEARRFHVTAGPLD